MSDHQAPELVVASTDSNTRIIMAKTSAILIKMSISRFGKMSVKSLRVLQVKDLRQETNAGAVHLQVRSLL